jgi:hypothetical protein
VHVIEGENRMRINSFKIVLSFAMMATSLVVIPGAWAQEAGAGAGTKPAPTTKRKAPPKVIELEELIVEGRIQKPEVFYVLGRAKTKYKAQKSRESFLSKIDNSVQENPF